MFGLKRLLPNKFPPAADIPHSKMLEWHEQTKFTPDYAMLEAFEFCIVFLYDELMSGHRSHDMVAGHDLFRAFTHKQFKMVKHQIGKFSHPVAVDPPQELTIGPIARAAWAPIRGEVYALRPSKILELDRYHHNGVRFRRVRVNIDIPHQEKLWSAENNNHFSEILHKYKRAWMYVGDFDYWWDFDSWSASNQSMTDTLLKTRPGNRNYTPNYHFTPNDF